MIISLCVFLFALHKRIRHKQNLNGIIMSSRVLFDFEEAETIANFISKTKILSCIENSFLLLEKLMTEMLSYSNLSSCLFMSTIMHTVIQTKNS